MKRSESQKITSVLLAAFLLLVLSICQVSAQPRTSSPSPSNTVRRAGSAAALPLITAMTGSLSRTMSITTKSCRHRSAEPWLLTAMLTGIMSRQMTISSTSSRTQGSKVFSQTIITVPLCRYHCDRDRIQKDRRPDPDRGCHFRSGL